MTRLVDALPWADLAVDGARHCQKPRLALGHQMHGRLALLGLVRVPPAHLGFALVKEELAALIILVSRIVPSLNITHRLLRMGSHPRGSARGRAAIPADGGR